MYTLSQQHRCDCKQDSPSNDPLHTSTTAANTTKQGKASGCLFPPFTRGHCDINPFKVAPVARPGIPTAHSGLLLSVPGSVCVHQSNARPFTLTFIGPRLLEDEKK